MSFHPNFSVLMRHLTRVQPDANEPEEMCRLPRKPQWIRRAQSLLWELATGYGVSDYI